ncbi:unnamed protein product [Didymodactylos carnosus]|uniref:G8 domain-containing protein n=1 Tax=Didymodactylos carnosus TaxID=1234261 RepID=A0A8S2HFV9_9BILA|nr:unnamed protein product [Didymodactylos carnosus]CAF3638386.1 unnamed protein product [Didymodactylos carnosus]
MNGSFGVWIFPEYSPTVGGNCWGDTPSQAVLEGLISWNNQKGVEWVMSSTVQFKNFLVFDNADTGISCVTAINDQRTDLPNLESTFYNTSAGSSVINSVIIGDTGNSGSPVVPSSAGLVVMWDRDGVYQDDDGTLSGVVGGSIVYPDGLMNGSSLCIPTPHFVNGITCQPGIGTWLRFALNNANLDIDNDEFLYIYDINNNVVAVPSLKKRLTHPLGYMVAFRANQSYTMVFQNANSTVNLSYTGAMYNLQPGDYVILRSKVDYMPDQVYITSSSVMAAQSQTPLSPTTSNNGDWYYDNSTNYFSFIVKSPSSNTRMVDVSLPVQVIKCRYLNCQYPQSPGLALPPTARPNNALYWSNDSDWYWATQGYGGYGSVKPSDGQNIYIPSDIWLVVDYPLPTILNLKIEGTLEFEQVCWPNNPLNASVDIIINGDSSASNVILDTLGSIGAKVIGVLGGLTITGLPRNVTWTRLGSTASSGQNTITLSQSVDWNVGEEIIVTTTDTNINHTEQHTIASINANRNIITTVLPLSYTHIVLHETFPNGQVYHVAGAVGLLTRNIRIRDNNPSGASQLFGYRVLVTDYNTPVWDPIGLTNINTYYKGYARLSNTQFIGFGQFVNADQLDLREGIHIYDLGDWNASRPTYVDSCSFNNGYFTAIGLWVANGIPITNNVIFNTYKSGIVINGQNNIIQNNLVSSIYWTGTAQPQFVQFNLDYDAAICSKDAVSVVMQDNFVAGVERLGIRIQGASCPGTVLPSGINNSYSNNEVHSAMAGVSIWPDDQFIYDTDCVLITGFKTYKAWYYGVYIQVHRNIIVDSTTVSDSQLGMFTLVIGIPALTHVAGNKSIQIRNSLVIGAGTPNDCSDVLNPTTPTIFYTPKAVPTVSGTGGRVGITFPYISSSDNMMPSHPWTGIGAYPTVDGMMYVSNTTFAYFNTVCGRQDVAISVAQHNDDGQFPMNTTSISVYNSSRANILFNGRPNLDVVDPSDCVDMDCDGLKKDLLIDFDGSLLGTPGVVFSQAEYDWGDQAHGVGDYRIPSAALSSLTGQMININLTYPYRGISRGPTCQYNSDWQMYYCPNKTDYRMLIIESMDSDTETRRLSPVGIFSDNGYIDLINGPQDHGWCNGYTCQKRISTFQAIIEGQHHYDIFLSSTQPNQIRFRIIDGDATIMNTLALHYDSLQQIDVYANGVYVSPCNRDPNYSFLMLRDTPNTVDQTSLPGSNYFNRTTQMAYFAINGPTVIDLKISQLIVLTFGLPPQTPASFYDVGSVVANLAALLNVPTNMIRRVTIISANNNTRIYRRQLSTITLQVEIRGEPDNYTTDNSTAQAQQISDVCSHIINSYQSGQMNDACQNNSNFSLSSLSVQEPLDQVTNLLGIINRLVLVTPPANCREQCPCNQQPVLVAYDRLGNIIQTLGSKEQPWQVNASVVGQPNINLIGATASYQNGQTQFSTFGLPYQGSYAIQFTFIQPNGVSSSYILSYYVASSAIPVTTASLAAKVVSTAYVAFVNQTFNISVVIVDSVSKQQIQNISWRGLTWAATVSLYTLPNWNSNGLLITTQLSVVSIDIQTGIFTASNLAISSIGMYVLNIKITSSNNEYTIILPSNGILIIANGTTLETVTGEPTTYITFNDDYDLLNASNKLEIRRATIYNYFLSIGLTLLSDLTLSKGSTIASFSPNTSNPATTTAVVANINSNPSASGSSVININIGSYSKTLATSSTTADSNTANNVGLIVGLVVGLVGAAALVLVAFGSYRAYKRKIHKKRLIDNGYESGINNDNDADLIPPPKEPNVPVRSTTATSVIRRTSTSSPVTTQNETNARSTTAATATTFGNKPQFPRSVSDLRMNSPLPRTGSATISITTLDFTNPYENATLPTVELIKFED